uniref:Uncharacterized protein n=1 Tax=Astatotilapia calliptera TaxID=8154 RepID=A0A3P8NCG4_ASTCA
MTCQLVQGQSKRISRQEDYTSMLVSCNLLLVMVSGCVTLHECPYHSTLPSWPWVASNHLEGMFWVQLRDPPRLT